MQPLVPVEMNGVPAQGCTQCSCIPMLLKTALHGSHMSAPNLKRSLIKTESERTVVFTARTVISCLNEDHLLAE